MSDIRVSILAGTVLALMVVGCQPAPEKEDEIQKTMRMIEEAKRGTAGASGAQGRNVYVSIERLRVAGEDAAGLGGLWRFASGRVTVSGSDGLGGGGVRLGLAGPEFEAKLSAYARKTRQASRTTEEIMVAPGAEGFLFVGREVLVPVLRLKTAAGTVEVLQQARVGASLKVLPRILEDGRIELQLSPHFSVVEAGKRGRTVSVTAMTTRVVVKPGERLVLGASSSIDESSAAGALFSFDSRGGRISTLVTVKADRL
jgi:type II secretory pathway component GspD/PulD (secretin)